MSRSRAPRSRSLAAATLTGLAASAAAVTVWGTLIERHLYTLRREALPAIPVDRAPLQVLQIADPHLAPWQRRRIDWIRSLRALNPDLVVITGDLMGHKDALPAVTRALEPFADVPGVFVYGSNDYYQPILKNPLRYLQAPSRRSTRRPDLDTPALTRMLTEDLGFVNINNGASDVVVGDTVVRAFGLGDPHVQYDNEERMLQSLAQLDETGVADVRLGVVHAPYQAACNLLLRSGADLIVAGHTHGGQVRIPGVGALTTNSDLPPAQARGLSVWFDERRATYLQVSAGIGHSLYAPVRVACRPEANLLTLTPRFDRAMMR